MKWAACAILDRLYRRLNLAKWKGGNIINALTIRVGA